MFFHNFFCLKIKRIVFNITTRIACLYANSAVLSVTKIRGGFRGGAATLVAMIKTFLLIFKQKNLILFYDIHFGLTNPECFQRRFQRQYIPILKELQKNTSKKFQKNGLFQLRKFNLDDLKKVQKFFENPPLEKILEIRPLPK